MDSNTVDSPVLAKEARDESQAGLSVEAVPQTKRGRGRPAKYAKEEREQKYKESRVQWIQENKDHIKEQKKEYYNDNQKYLLKMNKEYISRARQALNLMNDIWNQKEALEYFPPELRNKVQTIVEKKQVICL